MSIADLETGHLHLFSNFAAAAVPKNIAGVYTIWDGDRFIYVGIGGIQIRYTEPDEEAEPAKPVAGLRGRLAQHSTGGRSGDKFCIYVCDRFVLPSLTPQQIGEVGAGRLSLDRLTRDWIHARYSFRYIHTRSGDEARQIENEVKAGALAAGRPFLNPGS